MSNAYFQFKNFRISQDRCAMKVSTDACILGAATPLPDEGSLLDIGTGTGLLALMMAQRCPMEIDAVELDTDSYRQALENIKQSRYANRIIVIHGDIRGMRHSKKYKLIICNPPFFERHLRSSSVKTNKAKHADELSFAELTEAVNRNMADDGHFSVLLPVEAVEKFIKTASAVELYPEQRLLIMESEQHRTKREIILFTRLKKKHCPQASLPIKDATGNYSSAFVQLLQPFYLEL